MKKIISLIVVLTVIMGAFCMTAFAGDYYFMLAQIDNNKLFVNAGNIEFDPFNPEVKPVFSEKNKPLVPLRMVVGAAGGWIDWEEATDSVLINYNGKTISFVMGSKEVTVDGETVEISVAPYTIHDRTVVPLDFFVNCMGGSAEFDETTNTVMLGFETNVYAAG